MQSQRQDQQGQAKDGEIDLFFVYRKVSTGFANFYAAIQHTFSIVFRRKLLLASFIMLGAVLSYGLHVITKPYYTSSMTLVMADIRNEFIEEQLMTLSDMMDEGNSEAIAERLGISRVSAEQVKEMNFFNLDQDKVDEDSVLTGSPFRIELSLHDRTLFDSMEPALASFLESNRYFARQRKIKQREVENMVSKLRGEIASIDSIRTNISEPRGPVNGFVYGQPIDPTNLYKESISMYKEQVRLEAELEKINNVEIVTGFAPRLYPTGPNLINYLAIGILLSFSIGSIVAYNLEGRKHRSSL